MLTEAAVAVAAREDGRWQKRRRVFDTCLIVLFVFRLVLSGPRLGYRAVLCELWEQCQALSIPLPQPEPPAASSATEAREKLDQAAFLRVHREVLASAGETEPLWKGHRILAIDGSKINLPAPLVDAGYRRPHDNAHYPQGMVSCLYTLRHRVPIDFDLHRHEDERRAALGHLDHAREGDLIVYDRSYISFAMLHEHHRRGLDGLFRIPENLNTPFDAFIGSHETDRTLDLQAPRDHPLRGTTLAVRLVKGTVFDTEIRLATTLLDRERYTTKALLDLYHARWGIETLYDTLKETLTGFHAKSERGVKQELYAAFTLIALSRIFTNRCEDDVNRHGDPAIRTNGRNSMRLIGKEIETLFLMQGALVRESVARIMTGLSRCLQKVRPGRAYERVSKQPRNKWITRTA